MEVKVKSLNLLSYLKWNGEEITLIEEEDPDLKGLFYGIIDEEILNKYLDLYREDTKLHSFVNVYRDLRTEIANKRSGAK